MFSYFFHDIDRKENEVVIPVKKDQPLCKAHREPVIMFSLPLVEFLC